MSANWVETRLLYEGPRADGQLVNRRYEKEFDSVQDVFELQVSLPEL